MGSVLKFAFIAGLTFLVAAEVAYGQAQAPNYGTNDPGIQQRMQNQEQRIDQGVNERRPDAQRGRKARSAGSEDQTGRSADEVRRATDRQRAKETQQGTR